MVWFRFGLIKYVNDSTLHTAADNNEHPIVHDAGGSGLLICAPAQHHEVPWLTPLTKCTQHLQGERKTVEFYLYPTVGTVLIHSAKPELTE